MNPSNGISPSSSIYVAGGAGMVGSAIVRRLKAQGFQGVSWHTRSQLDLEDRDSVEEFFSAERPQYVFLAAAKVGGILANSTQPVEFLLSNLAIETNIIRSAHKFGARKLVFLGSSCIYPRDAAQPIREDALLSGPLEPTNEAYAIAKIAGIKMCQSFNREYGTDFISLMPTNLYGPNDNFGLTSSHVLPALLAKFHQAKEEGRAEVEVWGTGEPRREFLHVDDLARAAVFLLEKYSGDDPINVGVGRDISIRELALLIKEIVGFEGGIVFDTSKPDGMPRKLLDVTKINQLGWEPSIGLRDGIQSTYEWFVVHRSVRGE